MLHRLRKKSRVTHEELVADAIFFLVAGAISFLITLLFDVHHSFYEWPIVWTFIFKNPVPYVAFTLLGAIFGFFILKLVVFGITEEERAAERKRRR